MTRAIAVILGLTVLLVPSGWTQGSPAAAKKPLDPFVGSWKMNPEKSQLDPNHRVMAAKMSWEREADGYRLIAEGINARGQVVKEAPQRFLPDGKEHPVPGGLGMTSIVTRTEPNALRSKVKRTGKSWAEPVTSSRLTENR